MSTEEHEITKENLLQLLANGEQLSDNELQKLLQYLRSKDRLTDADRKKFLYYLANKDDLTDPELLELLASTKDPSNQKILKSLIDDPYDYFSRILDKKYRGKLYRYSYKLTGNREDAEDVCQEALANACRALSGPGYTLERLRDELNLEDWLYKITYHQFCDLYRHEKARRARDISLDKTSEPSEDGEGSGSFLDLLADPDEQLEVLVKWEETLGLMKRLPKKLAEPLQLRCFDDLSYEQIAEKLHLSEDKIKTRINRARELLRSMFEERNNEDILELIERLPENHQKVLRLLHLGQSDQEIAEKLRRPVDAIRSEISQSRKLLRRMFEELKNRPLKKPRRARRPLKKPLEEVN